MTMNSSGVLSLAGGTAGQSAEYEISGTASNSIGMNDASVRMLAGVSSGAISLSNLYGKSYSSYTPMTATGTGGDNQALTTSGAGSCSVQCYVTPYNGSGSYTYSWSIVTNSGVVSISNMTSQTCNAYHNFSRNTSGSAAATLQCIITDSTSHNITVSNINVTLEWFNNQ